MVSQIRRPFAFINSRIFVHAEQKEDGQVGDLVGEAQQYVPSVPAYAANLGSLIPILLVAGGGTLGGGDTTCSNSEPAQHSCFPVVLVRLTCSDTMANRFQP